MPKSLISVWCAGAADGGLQRTEWAAHRGPGRSGQFDRGRRALPSLSIHKEETAAKTQ